MSELPTPPSPPPPRYSDRPFPAYRFIPGRAAHPRRDPAGHSHGAPEPEAAPIDSRNWPEHPVYLYGVDLFNHAYWWESHEAFEAIFHASGGRESRAGRLMHSLIQLAAAQIKWFVGMDAGARRLADRATNRLTDEQGVYLGIDVPGLLGQVAARLAGSRGAPLRLELHFGPVEPEGGSA